MTTSSETRESELVEAIRMLADDADAFAHIPAIAALTRRAREAADTIDRLTSTGEAVGYVSHHGLIELRCGFSASIVAPEAADEQFNRPLYTHASPREGHVEVPVEPAAQVPSIDDITVAAELQFPGKGYAHDRMAFRLGADWCAKQLAALPHNQGETKP